MWAACGLPSRDAVALDHGAVHLDAEAASDGNRDDALDLLDRFDREMIPERVFFLLEFQHRRHRKQARRLVWERGKKLDGGGEADRRAPGMRHAFHAVGRGQHRDVLAFGDTAGRANIRLHDVHRLAHDRVAKAPAGEFVLAAGHRHIERAGHFDVTVDILRRDRLLEPFDVEFLQLAAEPDRGRYAEAMIGVDHQLDVGANGISHRLDALKIAIDRAEPDLHLDRLEALGDISGGFLDRFVDQPLHVGEIKSGGIAIHLAAERAANQLVDRLVARLADDVPERDVDAADCGDRHTLRPVILDSVIEVLPDHLDIEGIAADHARRQLAVDEGFGDRGGAVAFAPADNPVICLDFDETSAAGFVQPAARGGEGTRDRSRDDMTGNLLDEQARGPFVFRLFLNRGSSGFAA